MTLKAILTNLYKIPFSTYCNRIPYNIPYIGDFITYFFLGIGSCLGKTLHKSTGFGNLWCL